MPGGAGTDGFLSAEVHQATGMLSVQLDCTIAEALGRLRILARSTDQTLEDVAHQVVERIVRFDE